MGKKVCSCDIWQKIYFMKSIGLIMAAVVFLMSCGNAEKENATAENETLEVGESYGPVKVNVEEAITVEEMLEQYEGKTEEQEFTFVGKLTEVCSKAGCWINVDKGNGETFMVIFKDHFTIPTDTKIDTEAYLHGVAYWDTVSVELLQHFAEDAGKSPEEIAKITEPKYEFGFEADGITLKK